MPHHEFQRWGRGGAGGAKTDPKAGLPHCHTTPPPTGVVVVVWRMGLVSLRGGEVGQISGARGSMTMAIDFRKLQVGDLVDAPTSRGIWATDWEPAWFIFTVPPRGELPASAWLARNGVSECWYPSETAFKRNRFKPGQRIPYERPVAPGYLFVVLPHEPHWDVLFDRSRKKLSRVVSHNGLPVAVPETTIAAMAKVPQRLATIREAEAAKRRISPGDMVEISIAGIEWQVTVDRIHAGIASFIVPLLGGREVSAPVETLRKEQG